VAAATPHIGQSSPSGIVRGEGGAHDKAKASVVSATTGNLWSESEELLIDILGTLGGAVHGTKN
jgi:hypothetical protein